LYPTKYPKAVLNAATGDPNFPIYMTIRAAALTSIVIAQHMALNALLASGICRADAGRFDRNHAETRRQGTLPGQE
jgi:hypothetical protein